MILGREKDKEALQVLYLPVALLHNYVATLLSLKYYKMLYVYVCLILLDVHGFLIGATFYETISTFAVFSAFQPI